MNKNILYILLFSYASMMCKPVLPYVVDSIEHILFYNKHVTTVHIENGKMHVHKEAVDAGADTSDNNNTTHEKKSSTNWDHITPMVSENYSPNIIKIVLNQQPHTNSYHIFSFSDYPPPRLLFI